MAFTFSDTTVTNLLAGTGIATQFPAGARLQIYTGTAPAITAAPTGTLLAEITLPTSPWAAASARAIAKNGTWSVTAVAAGTAGWFRMLDASATDGNLASNTNQRLQGDVTATGGGGGMTLDNTNIASGQTVTVTGFTVQA